MVYIGAKGYEREVKHGMLVLPMELPFTVARLVPAEAEALQASQR